MADRPIAVRHGLVKLEKLAFAGLECYQRPRHVTMNQNMQDSIILAMGRLERFTI